MSDSMLGAVLSTAHCSAAHSAQELAHGTLAAGVDAESLSPLFLKTTVAPLVYILSTALAPFIFWIVNGFLLGREYIELVALRRMTPPEAKVFRRRHLIPVWTMGALLAFPLSIPIVNLVAPLVGVAAFVHLYHRKAGVRA